MDTLYHREEHFRGGDTVKDIIIGMSDGLTVPFALAAGISGAISAAHIVVIAGFAEIAAGSIAMGLGGYPAARSEVEHYQSELAREEAEIRKKPEVEAEEAASFFREYGLTEAEYSPVVAGLPTKPKAWSDFMMRFELGLEEPAPKRAL
jgi:vacuolar iron transporter family protein